MTRGLAIILSALALLPLIVRAQTATPTSRPAGVDDATWQRMLAIDAKAGAVKDLVADFEQQKFTAMLKKPLVSAGRVFVRGSSMLWDTARPEPNVLQINEREVRIYYPSQKTIEVYQIQQKLGQLAASPLPRLGTLVRHFSFKPLATSDNEEWRGANRFTVELTPTDPQMQEHVDRVRVALDETTGLIVRLEMTDPDGDRTVLTFSMPQTNVGVTDAQLAIAAPADVKVTRPLAAVEGAPRPPESK